MTDKQLFDLESLIESSTRIDERVKTLLESHKDLNSRINKVFEGYNELISRISVIENIKEDSKEVDRKIKEAMKDIICSIQDNDHIITSLKEDVSSFKKSYASVENKWNKTIDYGLKLVWTIGIYYVLYKLNLSEVNMP